MTPTHWTVILTAAVAAAAICSANVTGRREGHCSSGETSSSGTWKRYPRVNNKGVQWPGHSGKVLTQAHASG